MTVTAAIQVEGRVNMHHDASTITEGEVVAVVVGDEPLGPGGAVYINGYYVGTLSRSPKVDADPYYAVGSDKPIDFFNHRTELDLFVHAEPEG